MSDDQTPDAKTFDLDAWLSGATPPSRTFVLYRDADKYEEYRRLVDEYDIMVEKDDDAGGGDEALGERSPLAELDRKIRALESELKTDAIHGKVRSANYDEINQARRKSTRKDGAGDDELDQDEYLIQLTARTAVYPKLDPDGWRRLRAGVGEKQFAAVSDAVFLAADVTERLDVDFSSRRSGRR